MLENGLKNKIFYEGVKAAIVGRANVGKSSLLNKLLNEERAIVTEIPGTTRDILQETINIKGIPVKIIDTAGIRKARGKIEKMGVEKAIEWMGKAEMNILVLDGSEKLKEEDRKLMEKVKRRIYLIVINKIDLPVKIEINYLEKIFPSEKIVKISAKEGTGIEKMKDKIYNLIQQGYGKAGSGEFYLNLREEQLLKKIENALENALTSLKKGYSVEMVAEDLRQAVNHIDYLTGRKYSEEILEKIFSNFCIGK
ncbi:GTP-binding protein [bacterium]|nr:GTP-binding protein [bacterium]